MLEKDFKKIVSKIKDEIARTQRSIMSDANEKLIVIGKYIDEKSKWENKFINELELDLKLDFPTSKGFSARNLRI